MSIPFRRFALRSTPLSSFFPSLLPRVHSFPSRSSPSAARRSVCAIHTLRSRCGAYLPSLHYSDRNSRNRAERDVLIVKRGMAKAKNKGKAKRKGEGEVRGQKDPMRTCTGNALSLETTHTFPHLSFSLFPLYISLSRNYTHTHTPSFFFLFSPSLSLSLSTLSISHTLTHIPITLLSPLPERPLFSFPSTHITARTERVCSARSRESATRTTHSLQGAQLGGILWV